MLALAKAICVNWNSTIYSVRRFLQWVIECRLLLWRDLPLLYMLHLLIVQLIVFPFCRIHFNAIRYLSYTYVCHKFQMCTSECDFLWHKMFDSVLFSQNKRSEKRKNTIKMNIIHKFSFFVTGNLVRIKCSFVATENVTLLPRVVRTVCHREYFIRKTEIAQTYVNYHYKLAIKLWDATISFDFLILKRSEKLDFQIGRCFHYKRRCLLLKKWFQPDVNFGNQFWLSNLNRR